MKMMIYFLLIISLGSAHSAEMSADEVKKLYLSELSRLGYSISSGAKDALNEAAGRIADTINDMQDVKRHVDIINGKKQGLYYATYPNDQLQAVGNYRDDIKIGVYLYYFPNGLLLKKEFYDNNGIKSGQSVNYHRNGNIEHVEYYLNGKIEGPKTTFYENGRVYQVTLYVGGLMNGISYILHENGALKKMGAFINGKQEGEVLFYNNSGQLTERVNFRDGVRLP